MIEYKQTLTLRDFLYLLQGKKKYGDKISSLHKKFLFGNWKHLKHYRKEYRELIDQILKEVGQKIYNRDESALMNNRNIHLQYLHKNTIIPLKFRFKTRLN